MRAMAIDRFGGPDVLHLADLPVPEPVAGEVLIRSAFASVNPADWKIREGWLQGYFEYRFPFIVGFDAAGVVAKLGPGVTGYKVGDRVVTASNLGKGEWGSYAEYVKSDIDRVVRLPDHVGFADAASIPTAGITAFEGIFDVGHVEPGQSVLINGGAGGTGSYAIQLAKMAGAKVAATCSTGNLEYVRGLGADLAIDYRKEDIARALKAWQPDGVDFVFDTVGQGSLLQSVSLAKDGGIVSPIATLIQNEPHPDAADAKTRGVTIQVSMSSFERQGRQLRGLVDAMGKGKIRAPQLEILDLAQAAEALRRVQDGHVRGKILLKIADPGTWV